MLLLSAAQHSCHYIYTCESIYLEVQMQSAAESASFNMLLWLHVAKAARNTEAEAKVPCSLQVKGTTPLVSSSQELLFAAKLQFAAAADPGQTGQECVLASLAVTLCPSCAPQEGPAVSCEQATE